MKGHKAAFSRGEPARGGCWPPTSAQHTWGCRFHPMAWELPLQARGRPRGPGWMAERRRSGTRPQPECSQAQPPAGLSWRQGAPSQQHLQVALPLGTQHP